MFLVIKDGMACLHDADSKLPEFEVPLPITSPDDLRNKIETYIYQKLLNCQKFQF